MSKKGERKRVRGHRLRRMLRSAADDVAAAEAANPKNMSDASSNTLLRFWIEVVDPFGIWRWALYWFPRPP